LYAHSRLREDLARGIGALILFLIGSVTYGAVGPGVAMVSDTEPAIDSGGLDEDERFGAPCRTGR